MRTITFFTFLTCATIVNAQQQLDNPNFEQWSVVGTTWDNQSIYGADNWYGGSQTTDSYSGDYAAMVMPYMSCGIASGWMLSGGVSPDFNPWFPDTFAGSGTPVNFKPTSVSGYFKLLTPDTMDLAQGIVILRKFNTATQQSEEIGRGEMTFTPTAEYTAFNIDIADLQPGVIPDTMVIAFSSGMGYFWDWENDSLYFGTLYVDQLRMQTTGATAGIAEQAAMSSSFFPNPATGTLNITFTTAAKDDFSIVLTDATGKLAHMQRAEPGMQQTLDVSNFAAGSYHAFIRGQKGIYATELIKLGQ